MTPPPPGLFSTTAVCLRLSCNPVAISRATTSLEPPGVNGTMMRMVLLGKPCALPCAWAAGIEAISAMANAASSRVMHPHNCGAQKAIPLAQSCYSGATPCPRAGPVARVAGRQRSRSARTMATRKMKLGLFIRPGGHHIACWRHPRAQADAGVNFPHFVEMAQIAERGLFDMLFSADNHTVWTVSESAIDRVHYSRVDGALYAAVGAVRPHQEHRPRLHRQHELRAALYGRAQVRDARSHQRRPLRLERGDVRQRNRGAELQQGAASAEGRALQARARVRRGGARRCGIRGTRTRSSATRRPASSSTARRCTSSTITARSMTCAGRSTWRARRRASRSSCRPARPTTAASSRPKPPRWCSPRRIRSSMPANIMPTSKAAWRASAARRTT